jgi:hypothetical protein
MVEIKHTRTNTQPVTTQVFHIVIHREEEVSDHDGLFSHKIKDSGVYFLYVVYIEAEKQDLALTRSQQSRPVL